MKKTRVLKRIVCVVVAVALVSAFGTTVFAGTSSIAKFSCTVCKSYFYTSQTISKPSGTWKNFYCIGESHYTPNNGQAEFFYARPYSSDGLVMGKTVQVICNRYPTNEKIVCSSNSGKKTVKLRITNGWKDDIPGCNMKIPNGEFFGTYS